MDIYEELTLEECPFCGGPGLLEEENGWCFYAVCMDCGSQTASFAFEGPEERSEAARKAAALWNMRKVVRSNISE